MSRLPSTEDMLVLAMLALIAVAAFIDAAGAPSFAPSLAGHLFAMRLIYLPAVAAGAAAAAGLDAERLAAMVDGAGRQRRAVLSAGAGLAGIIGMLTHGAGVTAIMTLLLGLAVGEYLGQLIERYVRP